MFIKTFQSPMKSIKQDSIYFIKDCSFTVKFSSVWNNSVYFHLIATNYFYYIIKEIYVIQFSPVVRIVYRICEVIIFGLICSELLSYGENI